MGRRCTAVLLAAVVALLSILITGPRVAASPGDEYTRPYWGPRDIPPGCKRDSMRENLLANVCHHIRTDLNGLDSPIVDVLVLVPASPFAEREARTMRQAAEMWEGGIDYLAPQMGLDWLSAGTDFRITVDTVNPADDGFSFYPVVDPEVVIVATNPNPVLLFGIGIDPMTSPPASVEGVDAREGMCHGLTSALFDFGFWQALPGFDDHHGRSGTYTEDCGGAGGNVCFAVNAGADFAPLVTIDELSFFDLVAHEVGHCLSVGHVGDGLEGAWGKLPPNDIMAYDAAPADRTKCVSTLDVEAIAPRMSKYLDVNRDGVVNRRDRIVPNDPAGDGESPFQTQHPRDHFYASRTGSPLHCPQPRIGVVPGPRTDWTPDPVATATRVLTVSSPSSGARTRDPSVTVAGDVDRGVRHAPEPPKAVATGPRTVTFEHEAGNTFYLEDSTLGVFAGGHSFTLDVAEPANVALTLAWDDPQGQTDLDLYVTGAADSGSAGATTDNPERVNLAHVRGRLEIQVDPYLVLRPEEVTYTLTAVIADIAPPPITDRDGDDTPDERDVCIDLAGDGADGCPMDATERVLVYLDDATRPAASHDVDTTTGRDDFAVPVWLPKGRHTLRVVWAATSGKVYATRSVAVTRH